MPPKVTRKELQPFGGIQAQAAFQALKERALRDLTRQQCFDQGYLTVKDMDDEELRHGKMRDQFGNIPKSKGKTDVMPQAKYQEMVAEHELRFKHRLRERLDSMIDVMVDIAEDETVEPRDRLEAAKYIFERTAGKTPETVNVNVDTKPWEEMFGSLAGIAAMSRAEHKAAQAATGTSAGILDVESEDITDNELGRFNQPHRDRNQNGEEASGVYEEDSEEASEVREGQGEGHSEEGPATGIPEEEEEQEEVNVSQGMGQEVAWADGALEERPPKYVTADSDSMYGRKPDENRSYAKQARDAAELAKRRKEARENRNAAKKQRKIARAMGADAIKSEIVDAKVDDDGTVRFSEN